MTSREPVLPRIDANRNGFADILRGSAVAVVIGVHLSGYFSGTRLFAGLGIVAVNGFFVLSGFLLSGSYLRAILNPSSPFPSSRIYALRRFVRIYPAYFTAVIITAGPYFLVRNNHGVSIFDVIAHLTMTHGFFEAFAQSAFNVPLWTMAVEVQFYLLLPMVAFGLRRIARLIEPSQRGRLVLGSLALCIVVSLVIRLWVYRATPARDDFRVALVFARNAIGLGSSFALGIAIAYARIEDRNPSRSLSIGLVALATVCALVLIVDGAQFSHDYVVQVMYDFVGALGAAALLYGVGQGAFRSIHQAAAMRPVTWVAKLSFGLYLFHKPFSNLAMHLIGNRLPPYTLSYGLVIALFTIPCSIAAAMLLFTYIEVPCRSFADRKLPITAAGATIRGALDNVSA